MAVATTECPVDRAAGMEAESASLVGFRLGPKSKKLALKRGHSGDFWMAKRNHENFFKILTILGWTYVNFKLPTENLLFTLNFLPKNDTFPFIF